MQGAASPRYTTDVVRAFGRYEVIQPLAIGGMAELFLARARAAAGFEKTVVVKRILPNLATDSTIRTLFLDEARLAATLEHPNIVQVFDLGDNDGELYFVMEYVHGADVARLARAADDPLPLAVAIEIVVQAAAGLHHAHEHVDRAGRPLGIVHRDISPSNLLCTWGGNIKIADFGIAKATSRSPDARTRTGALRGKAMYMSPEHARGEPIDARSDVFALAVVLWELTTGRRLYDGEHEYAVLLKVATTEPIRPSEVCPGYPSELEQIVLRGLCRDRDARYPSARALHDDLERFARTHDLPSGPTVIADAMRERLGPPSPLPLPALAAPRTATPPTVIESSLATARPRRLGAGRAPLLVGALALLGGALFAVQQLAGEAVPPRPAETAGPQPPELPAPALPQLPPQPHAQPTPAPAIAQPAARESIDSSTVARDASARDQRDTRTANRAPLATPPSAPARKRRAPRHRRAPDADSPERATTTSPRPTGALDLDSALP